MGDGAGRPLWADQREGRVKLFGANGGPYLAASFQEFYDSCVPMLQTALEIDLYGHKYPCFLADHHFAHNATAFLTSPFDRSACLSVDYLDGRARSYMVGVFDRKAGRFDRIRTGTDFDAGQIFGQVTDFLGFYPSLDGAGKTMALAAYGDPRNPGGPAPWPSTRDGTTLLNGDPFASMLFANGVERLPDRRCFVPQLEGEGGQADPNWLKAEDWDSDRSANLAASVQNYLEVSLGNMVEAIRRELGNVSDNKLCLSGGTLLNVVANGRVLWGSPASYAPDEVYLHPACGDDGLSIGPAMYLSHWLDSTYRTKKITKNIHRIEGGKAV